MSEKIKIFFINSIKISYLDNYHFYFNYSEEEEKISQSKINSPINNLNEILKEYSFDVHELTIDKNKALELNSEIIHMFYIMEKKDNKVKDIYEVNINYDPNRTNFIFDFKIGNLLNKNKISPYNFGYNLTLEQIFFSFYNHINENISLDFKTEAIESFVEDTKKYLEKTKEENIDIKYHILFFLLVSSKNKDIKLLLELINKKKISYLPTKLYKTEEIVSFLKDIFSNLENSENSWPFNEIKKFDKNGEEDVEENEEEEEIKNNNDNDNKINTEDRFIEYLIGYFSRENLLEHLSLFFMNEKIKKKTTKVLSKITISKFISTSVREKFMELYDNKNEIFEVLKAQTNFVQYLTIINKKFTDLFELTKKVGLEQYKILLEKISENDDLEEINKLHKEILLKEKEINNFFIDFISCVPKFIAHFKNHYLYKLICLIEFIDDEKKMNTLKNINYKANETYLRKAIYETIVYCKKYEENIDKKIFIEIIPKMKTIFLEYKEKDKFMILEAANIETKNTANLDLLISEKILKSVN